VRSPPIWASRRRPGVISPRPLYCRSGRPVAIGGSSYAPARQCSARDPRRRRGSRLELVLRPEYLSAERITAADYRIRGHLFRTANHAHTVARTALS
jgi:hypothetical protein